MINLSNGSGFLYIILLGTVSAFVCIYPICVFVLKMLFLSVKF